MKPNQQKAILFLTELKRKCDTELKFSTAEICTYLKVGKQWATVAFNIGFYQTHQNRYKWTCIKPISIELADEFLQSVSEYSRKHKQLNKQVHKPIENAVINYEEQLNTIEHKLDLLLKAFNL